MADLRIAHLVNPVAAPPGSDLARAQPVTFGSMRVAVEEARVDRVDVQVYAAAYPEDRHVAPSWVRRTADLERSVLDLKAFERPRKLPLLRDLVDRVPTDVDLCIYSNVDIALMPYFYRYVASAHRAGVDAMVINRRTITDRWDRPEDLVHMYAEVGEPHPGRDCFVFRPEVVGAFDIGDVIIGAGDVGRPFTWNLALTAKRFEWLRDHHLSFHLGDDRGWDKVEYFDYHEHNNDQNIAVLERLEAHNGSLRDVWPISELLPRVPGYWGLRREAIVDPPSILERLRRKATGRIGRG